MPCYQNNAAVNHMLFRAASLCVMLPPYFEWQIFATRNFNTQEKLKIGAYHI